MEATARQGRWKPGVGDVKQGDLPVVYREVADLIGLEVALQLVEWRGGQKLLIPMRPRAEHPLVRHLGPEAAARLVKGYGGSRIDVPTLKLAMRGARDRAIRAARAGGTPVSTLVRTFGLAERRIQQIIAEG